MRCNNNNFINNFNQLFLGDIIIIVASTWLFYIIVSMMSDHTNIKVSVLYQSKIYFILIEDTPLCFNSQY